MDQESPPEMTFGPGLAVCLHEAVELHALHGDTRALARALHATCAEAHARNLSVVEVVIALRCTWAGVPRPASVTAQTWSRMYLAALRQSLAMYFDPDCAPSGDGDVVPVERA